MDPVKPVDRAILYIIKYIYVFWGKQKTVWSRLVPIPQDRHIRRFHKASGYKGNRWQNEVGLYGYGFQNGVSCASPF